MVKGYIQMSGEITSIATDAGFTRVVNKLFGTETPKVNIKSRPGPGGKTIKYVEVGYVISKLNEAFGPFWEWRIIDKQIGHKQVWVQGELTVKSSSTFSITKAGFGGSAIKISTQTGQPINIASDLKAASSDALKKAASLFGIASDVFYKEMQVLENTPDEVTEDPAEATRQILMRKMFAIAKNKGVAEDEIDHIIKEDYSLESKKDLTSGQLQDLIALFEKREDI